MSHPPDARIHVVVATYKQRNHLPLIIHSFLVQTDSRWRMLIVHDGPDSRSRELVDDFADSRLVYLETPDRHNDWGHSPRAHAIPYLESEFVLFTNADNYYMPVFVARMCPDAEHDLCYCDMIHNHVQFNYRGVVKTHLANGQVDCGAVVVRAEIAMRVGWQSRRYDADWHFISAAFQAGARPRKIEQVLFVHN